MWLYRKTSDNKFEKFIQENMPNDNDDFVTDTILNSEIPIFLAC